jgi:hypothetical protein
MITINTVELTNAQLEALIKLVNIGWTLDYSTITKLPREQCITIVVKGQNTGATMTMGIEADGYTHS